MMMCPSLLSMLVVLVVAVVTVETHAYEGKMVAHVLKTDVQLVLRNITVWECLLRYMI